MPGFRLEGTALVWEMNHETLAIQPWGRDGLRVRATMGPAIVDLPGALLEPAAADPRIEVRDEAASIRNGRIAVAVSREGGMRFFQADTGATLLQESCPGRSFKPLAGDLYHLEAGFKAYEGERLYGLGQHPHGFLDQKGCVVPLAQRNTAVAIPFLLSNRGYGFLWNNSAIGRVELGRNETRWVAEATRQLDYFVTAGASPAEIVERYADATGHAPLLPDWAAGFWQSKLRYASQEELLAVAREYRRRGLPLAVIVVDFFHWTMMGDWKFDPVAWPDPAAMVHELAEMGVRVMVSIWPTVNSNSPNFEEMARRGLLVRTERGVPAHTAFMDTQPQGRVYLHLYDATHPEARRFIWEQVRENYYRAGIKVWWLDAGEPEFYPTDHDNLHYHLGNGLEVGCLYPLLHQRAFYEGMRAEGEEEIVTLSRSAWAGSQRYGAAVWSGDIASSFESLRAQVRAGLNIGLSGIPWWTTDIGGFHGGDIQSPSFRELIVRWFQYGAFCPLFRLHGFRLPRGEGSGAPNEVWSFGEEAYAIIREILFLRERLRPYIMEQMRRAHETGAPPMRPLFFDFPEDEVCWQVEDQFLLGPDLLVAPVLYEGARQRAVYLPAGAAWTAAWTDEEHAGGQWIEAAAPLERIPLYLRGERRLPIRGSIEAV